MPASRYTIAFIFLVTLPNVASAASAIQTYRTQTGQYSKTLLTTPVGSNNAPLVSTYKGSDGQWHPLVVTQQVCSLDANGAPQGCDNLTTNLIGQPSGIAGLDAHGNLTNNFTGSINGLEAAALVGGGAVLAPVSSPVLTGAPMTSEGQQPLVSLGRFPVGTSLSDSRVADPFQSPDALYIGGLPTQGWAASNGSANNDQARPGSLVVTGQPWGPYNAGALENLLWGGGVDKQNGIANVDWRAGAVPPFDGVAQYIGVTNTEAMIVAPAQFAKGQVTITPALSQTQISQLRVGMYISTNIINSQVSTAGPTDWIGAAYPIANYYQGIISGWKQTTNAQGQPATVINVPAWDSYDFTNHSTAAVPGQQSGDAVDTVRSNYGAPMVFIGNDTGEAAHNEYIFYDGSKSSTQTNGGHATALSHALGDDEIDMRYYATQPNEVYVTGLTLSLGAMGNSPVGREAITSGSYLLNLSSGDAPNLLVLDGASDANIVQGHSFYLHGQEGTFFPLGSTAGAKGIRQVQTNFSFTDYADSQNAMNLIGYQIGYGKGTGYANTSYHLGLHTDGNIMQPTTSGYNQGEIEWNPKGQAQGSIGVCASSENCGLLVNGNGTAVVPNGLYFASPNSGGVSSYTTEDDAANLTFHASNGTESFANLKAATFTATAAIITPTIVSPSGAGPADPAFAKASLPTGSLSDGQRAWCSDCVLNGITGVQAVWHASASRWTDSQNAGLSTIHP